MMRCLLIPLLFYILCRTTASALPEINLITEPACNSEVAVIVGHGFVPGRTRVKALALGGYDMRKPQDPLRFAKAIGRPPDLPDTPPPEAQECEIVGQGEVFLQVLFRCLPQSWVCAPLTSAVWVGDESGWGRPILINRPQAQWLYPQRQAPGEPIRIFGRTFAWGWLLPSAHVLLRPVGSTQMVHLARAAQHHEDGHTERWSLCVWLPESLAEGEYEVFVHGRHGAEYGWSSPLRLTVAQKPSSRPVVSVREHGAVGDGLADDTAALEAALRQTAPGGTLFLPAGTYAISRTLNIPEDVVIQGAGMRQSVIANRQEPCVDPFALTQTRPVFDGKDLLWGMRRFALRDLTLRFMPALGSALRVGRDPLWSEDVSLYRVRLETQQDFGLSPTHPYCARPLNIVKARRFSMVRCETYGPGACSCERKVEDSLFSQNRFITDRRWRGHGFKFWGAEQVIFEDNLLSGDTRGLVMQTHFGVNYRNFIAGNTVERTVLGENAGETYLVEGAGYLGESAVEEATPTHVRIARWPTARGAPATAEMCVGRFVVIAGGRGIGQWRRVRAADPAQRVLYPETPWRVPPDASSVVVMMNGLIDTVFVNNQETDCGKGLYIYGAGAINCIIDRHLCARTLGITFKTHDDRQNADPMHHQTAPDFFNLIRDCRVHDGGGLFCAVGGRLPLEERNGVPWANFANRFIANEIQNVTPFSGAQYGANWTWGGGWDNVQAGISVIPSDLGTAAGSGSPGPERIRAATFQKNWISGSRFGVGVSRRAADTLLMQTTVYDVDVPLTDKGRDTREKATVVRTPETYSPERGPIR